MLIKSQSYFLGFAAILGVLTSHASFAGLYSGRVMTSENAALAGAIVTLWNETRDQKISTYTDKEGYYALESEFEGSVILRGRSPYYRDQNVKLQVVADQLTQQNLLLEKLTDAEEISQTLPASAHVTKLNLNENGDRDTFITQCNFCHQQGNSLTRAPRSEEVWSETIWRMEGYGATITYEEHDRLKKLLHEGFDGKAVDVKQTQDFSPELAQTQIHEWLVATPMSFLHDTVVADNGRLYGIDEGSDTLWELDRATGQVIANVIPNPENLPKGGNFEGAQLPIGIFTGHHGPHSGAQIRDGRIFLTSALSSNLVSFTPETREFKLYPIPRGFLWRKGVYSHTIRADKNDNVWFTVLASNMVMKFDTHTETFTEVKLPVDSFTKWMSDTFVGAILKIASFWPEENYHLKLSHHKTLDGGREFFDWPYGIDVHPKDQSVWYSKLLGNKIGRIDPETLDIKEYDSPFRGPRRMRFDHEGILWIPSFDEGILMRFDPKTESFENIPLPLLSEDEYEVPYALNVHEETGDIWIAANNSDRVLRYIPNEKRFVSYPMPARVVWFRDFEFTKDGQVCTSNSNLPAYAHEDGLPAFFCIDPDATPNTKAKIAAVLPQTEQQ